MAHSGNTGLTRIWKAGLYSWKGFRSAFKHEEAFRQLLTVFLVLAPVGYWVGSTGLERALLIGSLFLILIVELLNSAIEAVVDRFGAEIHRLSGRAKDMGSAASVIAQINCVVIWILCLTDGQ